LQKTTKTIIIAMAVCVCVGLTSVCPAEDGESVLHFPGDRTAGKVFTLDDSHVRQVNGFYHWTEDVEDWQYHCPAKGAVYIQGTGHDILDFCGRELVTFSGGRIEKKMAIIALVKPR